MDRHYNLTFCTSFLLVLAAAISPAGTTGAPPAASGIRPASPPADSLYKGWYFTPTGVFGRGPLDKPKNRAFFRVRHPSADLAIVENVNPAGVVSNIIRFRFNGGLIALSTETNRWNESYDSTWYQPDGPGKFLVTRRKKGVNPFLPAKFLEYTFKDNLLTDIVCYTDSVHAGPGKDGVAHYRFELYDDPDRRGLIKSKAFFTAIDMPAFSVTDGCHKLGYEYDKKGDLLSQTVYDDQDTQVPDRYGIFLTKYVYDDDDNPVRIYFYDRTGNLTVSTNNYEEKQLKYKRGFLTEESYWQDAQTLAAASRLPESASVITHKYDQEGNETEIGYLNERWDPVNRVGVAQINMSYTESGMLARMSFIPTDKLHPLLLGKVFITNSFTHDEKGRVTSQRSETNTGMRIQDIGNGAYLTRFTYDDWGRIHSTSFWENDTTKMTCNLGYHEIVSRYDENGEVTERSFFDINGGAATATTGYSREVIAYNPMGMLASRAWFAGEQRVNLNDPLAHISHYHRILFNYDLAWRIRSVDFFGADGKPIGAVLRPDSKKLFSAKSIALHFEDAKLASETLTDSTDEHPTLDCVNDHCIALTSFEAHTRVRTDLTTKPLGAYHGPWQPDSLFGNMLGFIGRDTVLSFLTKNWGSQADIGCAELYRVAPINKYYLLDGLVRDYYLANDSIAASFNYDKGQLEGPAYIFYPNGLVKERGSFQKNQRFGIWEYYYDNGQRERTLQYNDGQPGLIDCYTRDGVALAQNGTGRFEGFIAPAMPRNVIEMYAKGGVKDGVPDGEWDLYLKQMEGPANTEYFSKGRFRRGISYTALGKSTYTGRFYSNLTGAQTFETINPYRFNPLCSPGLGQMPNLYALIRKKFDELFQAKDYGHYSGWVFLDLKLNPPGKVDAVVHLCAQNDEFGSDIKNIFSNLRVDPALFAGSQTRFEKMYILLVENSQLVIPEELSQPQRFTLQ
jgi:antitoxin component YwqK of YwqJK toxin-antitoxin module